MRIVIALAFIGIIASLGAALLFMMRGDPEDNRKSGSRMVNALAIRVGLSIILFVCLLLAYKLGYIQPGGWRVGML